MPPASRSYATSRAFWLPGRLLAASNPQEMIRSGKMRIIGCGSVFCAGEIVAQASLTEMSTFEPAAFVGSHGLGLYDPAKGYAHAFGHTGQEPAYMSWAACLPEEEAGSLCSPTTKSTTATWRSPTG